MSLRGDQRGQAIQVGAVLLFAVLIVAFSTYQAVIVPADNRRVEFNHNQEVQDRLAELRTAVLGTAGTTSTRAVTIPLGTTYPSRTLGLNPNSPGGGLRTVGTTDPMVNLSIDNAEASGEAGDFWDGTARSYNTGGIEYSPIYNRYEEAPTTVYEHSLLYNQFPNSNMLVLGNQTLVGDGRLSIVTVNGSIDRTSSRSTTVDVRPVSSGGGTVSVSAAGPPIILNFSSQFPKERWDAVVPDRHTVSEGTFPSPDGFHSISVELAEQENGYRLGMAKAGVGQGVTREDAAYLIDVAGDGVPVQPGSERELTLAVRDRYNNPVSGVPVHGTVDGTDAGQLENATVATDADGEATFTYETTNETATDTHEVNFTYLSADVHGPSFEPDGPENVTMRVTVSESGGVVNDSGAYNVMWTNPDDENPNDDATLSSCDTESCVWDVGDSGDDTLLLNASLRPPYEGIGLEFALNTSTVGSLSTNSGTSGPDGAATTELTAEENGTVDVLASGNDGSDLITIDVQNVTEGGLEYAAGSGTATVGDESRVDFDVRNPGAEDVIIVGIRIESTDQSLQSIRENNGGTGAGQREVYVDASDPGYLETMGDEYSLGSDIALNEQATLSPGEEAQVTVLHFQDWNGNTISAAGKPLTVTLYLQNGDSTTFSFTPPGY